MLALFCLRLAFGLFVAMLVLPASHVNPRFFRTHLLILLGLAAVAAASAWETLAAEVRWALGTAMLLAFAGSFSWSLEDAPGGRTLILMTGVALGTALTLSLRQTPGPTASAWLLADGFTGALVLGMALSAMLLGHLYLIAPGMALAPLFRLLGGLALALAARTILAGLALMLWASERSLRLTDLALLWLPVRWGLGLLAPAVLTGMAWQSARIRSTQSATGILYIAVVFCFLGELMGLLLLNETGYPL